MTRYQYCDPAVTEPFHCNTDALFAHTEIFEPTATTGAGGKYYFKSIRFLINKFHY
jgi:hypothetical protein